MKKISSALLFLLFSLVAVTDTNAKDYGTMGVTYSIIEKDFLQEIQIKLKAMEQSGQLAILQNNIKKQLIKSVNQPRAVVGITETKFAKSWLYDPAVFLDHDLADQNGRVFYRAGSKVNPFDHISLTRKLIFIDGDDEKQVKWAIVQDKKYNGKTKIILVKGRVIDLIKQNKVRLYFDQNGTLTSKFSISHTPATIIQEGKMLRISEVLL